MLRLTPLLPPRTDRRHISRHALLICLVRPWRQLDQAMQRDLHPRALLLADTHEIRIDASQYGLMGDDEDVLAPFQLHNDRFKPDDNVSVALAAEIAVIVLVLVARREVLRVLLLDLAVRHAVADTGVQLIEGFPGELFVRKMACCLCCALERGGPHRERSVASGLRNETR